MNLTVARLLAALVLSAPGFNAPSPLPGDEPPVFAPRAPSCEDRCGEVGLPIVNGEDPCSCATDCSGDGTCCGDVADACPGEADSCVGHCGDRAPAGCSCEAGCTGARCCFDAVSVCSAPSRVTHGEGGSVANGAVSDGRGLIIGGAHDGSIDFGGVTLASTPGDSAQDGFVARYAGDGALEWAVTVGGPMQVWVHDVAVDGQGYVYAVGHYWGTAEFLDAHSTSVGRTDAFLLCLTPEGDYSWLRTWGGVGYDHAYNVVAGDRRWVFVSGDVSGSVDLGTGPVVGARHIVAAFDETGQTMWTHAIDTGVPRSPSLALVTEHEDLLVATAFVDTVDLGRGPMVSAGGSDVLVARYDYWGTHVSPTFAYGGPGDETVDGLDGDDWGNVFVSGTFDQAWSLHEVTLELDSDPAGTYVGSFNNSGLLRWIRDIPGAYTPVHGARFGNRRLATDSGGNVWFAAYHEKSVDLGGAVFAPVDGDVVLASYTSAGNLRTFAQASGAGGEYLGDVTTDRYGRAYLYGYSYGTTELPGASPVASSFSNLFFFRHPD
ncbi:MAG: hypothetical protein AAFZ38_00495 [Myxococcota bacterium]